MRVNLEGWRSGCRRKPAWRILRPDGGVLTLKAGAHKERPYTTEFSVLVGRG